MIREQSHQALILFHIHQAIVDHCAELLWLGCRLCQRSPGGNGHKKTILLFPFEVPNKRELFILGEKRAKVRQNKWKCLGFSNYIPNHL